MSRERKLLALIFSVSSLAILKYVADHGAILPQILQTIAHWALPISGGFITLSLCSLPQLSQTAGDSASSRLSRRISEDPARNFFAGFLLVAYLNIIRPPIIATALFLPYVEWFAVALGVYVLYRMTGFSGGPLYPSSEDLGWKKHVQEVKRETGRDLPSIARAMQQFVDNGAKEVLLVYLATHLQRLSMTDEEILEMLRPLIDYREIGPSRRLNFSTLFGTKVNQPAKNKRTREILLKSIFDRIEGLGSE